MNRSVYIGGSSVLLHNPKDIDYFYYFDTNEERVDALRKSTEQDCDCHFVLFEKAISVFLGCWAYPYMQYVAGEVIEGFAKFSIFEHKEKLKSILTWYANRLDIKHKKWYHILILCYMFENKKMKLTNEQIEKVQKVHDKGATKTIKNYCLMQIDLIE